MVVQSTLTSGPSLRALLKWMARAISSLPVPLSPRNSTVAAVVGIAGGGGAVGGAAAAGSVAATVAGQRVQRRVVDGQRGLRRQPLQVGLVVGEEGAARRVEHLDLADHVAFAMAQRRRQHA